MLPLADPHRFVGRHRDLVSLNEAFESRSRLITLHGGAGVGKSRMASEHLHAVTADRRAIAVDLEHCRSLPDALALLASRIGAPPATGRDPSHVLGEALRELGPTTLVLDAVDGVHEVLRSVLSRWLKLSPETHFLLTAHAPLSIDQETALAVQPLALPSDVSERVISDAVRLWHITRGTEPRKLPRTSDPELVRLLRALGGLPLAIEITAAHSDRLTPFALLERLPNAVRLEGGLRDPRDVLEALLDLVWSLLSKTERLVLAQCSVFAASFDHDALSSVIVLPDSSAIQAALEKLCQRRLMQRTIASGGDARWGLHAQVRAHASVKLAVLDPERATLRRHSLFFVERGALRSNELEGPTGPAAILELIRMQPELMAIIAGDPLPSGSVTPALRALCIHDHVLSSHGPVDANLAQLDAWLSSPEADAVDPAILSEARCVRAVVRARIGQIDQARTDLAEAERLMREPPYSKSDDASRVAMTAAFVALIAGDLTVASASIERSLRIAEATGHARLQGIALGVKSLVRHAEKKPDEAIALYERALALHRSVQNLRFEGIVLTRLAQAHLERGELERASESAERARALHRTFGDRAMEGLCLVVQGTVYHARAQLDLARGFLEAARPLLRAVGDTSTLATATSLLATASAELGDIETARSLFKSVTNAAAATGVQRTAMRAELWCASLDSLLDESAEQVALQQADAMEKLRAAGDTSGLELAALSRILCQLARVREARSAQQSEAENEHLLAARASLHAARMAISRSAPTLPFPGRHELVTALRFTELMLAAHTPVSAAPRQSLRLPFHARWFLPPMADRTDASERGAMRRILVHLGLRASAAPNIAQTASSLFAAGWPGENPGEENARLQVYAVLGGLRKAGLGAYLVADANGHYLDPAPAITWVA